MSLPELSARGDATVVLAPAWDRDGHVQIVVVIKQRFEIGPRGQTRRVRGAEVNYTDVPWDPEAERSSPRLPCDLCLHKPSTDVLVSGHAVAPAGRPVRELDVLIRVGPVERGLHVLGPRRYYRGAFGLSVTEATPFEQVPLQWELAYGGADSENPKKVVIDRRNPFGRGVAASAETLEHKPAPQIFAPGEDTSGKNKVAPAGFAPLSPDMEARARHAGTMDEAWETQRMPLRPLDFDERFHQVAPPELITPRPLRGGEPFALVNLSARGPLQGTLPRIEWAALEVRDRGRTEHRPVLDTVVFEPDGPGGPHVDLTWRTAMPRGRRPDVLRSVLVYEKAVLT
jgi:hypothetical protein